MLLKFSKYQGAGNDFIIIDSRNLNKNLFNQLLVSKLCDRNFGIGADGLILLLESRKYDFRMKYFNSDGREGTMCGNGGRCIAAFANKLNIIDKNGLFEGIDGLHEAKILENNIVSLKMSDVNAVSKMEDGLLIETGSRHFVMQVEDVNKIKVFTEGRQIRYQDRFGEEGTNVNFIEEENNGLKIRTYERGVENETLACGTGAVAAAIFSHITKGYDKFSYNVHARGGNLQVDFTPRSKYVFENIWLTGPATFVFEGIIEINPN